MIRRIKGFILHEIRRIPGVLLKDAQGQIGGTLNRHTVQWLRGEEWLKSYEEMGYKRENEFIFSDDCHNYGDIIGFDLTGKKFWGLALKNLRGEK